MKRNIHTALTTLILAATLHAKEDKIAKDDIPRNEKKMWMKINAEQEKIESSLLSGDQRFIDQLDLARKKVADIMLTAEDEKKNRAAVKQLPRAWYFWKRVTAQVEIDDVNEYNLNTALGQRAPEALMHQEAAQDQLRQYGPQYGSGSASQVSGFPSINIYNNNGNGGQTNGAPNYPPQTANYQPYQPQVPPAYQPYVAQPQYAPTSNGAFACLPEVPFCQPPTGYVAAYNRRAQAASGYVTFGITVGRPARGYPVYVKPTKGKPGYYRGSAEAYRAPEVSRGGGGRR